MRRRIPYRTLGRSQQGRREPEAQKSRHRHRRDVVQRVSRFPKQVLQSEYLCLY